MASCPKCGQERVGRRCKPCWTSYMLEYNRMYRKTEKCKVKAKQYREKRKEIFRDYKLRQQFGISTVEYDQFLKDQNFVCAVCKLPEIAIHNKTKRPKRLAVDHDHQTGKVRGLLCQGCNTALGALKDSEENIVALLHYLKDSNTRSGNP